MGLSHGAHRLQMPPPTPRRCCGTPRGGCSRSLASLRAQCRWSGTWRWQGAAHTATTLWHEPPPPAAGLRQCLGATAAPSPPAAPARGQGAGQRGAGARPLPLFVCQCLCLSVFVPSRGAAAPIKVLESSRGLRVGELRTTPPLQNAPLYCTAATTAQCERFQSPRHRGGWGAQAQPHARPQPRAGTQQPSHRPPRTSTKRRAQHRALRAPRGQREHRVPGEGAPRGGARSPHSHSEGPGLLGGGAHRRAGVGAVAGTALRQQLWVHSSCQPCQAMQAHDACLSPRH